MRNYEKEEKQRRIKQDGYRINRTMGRSGEYNGGGIRGRTREK